VRRFQVLEADPESGDVSEFCLAVSAEMVFLSRGRGALDRLGYGGVVGLEAWASGDPVQALERFRAAFTVPEPPVA
jgi:hypothetical protein